MTRLYVPRGVTRPLPFDWKDFCENQGTDCVPACFAMSARYWKRLKPDLPLPTDRESWDDFILFTSARTSRGTSLLRLLRNIPTPDRTPISELHDQGIEALQEEVASEASELEPEELEPEGAELEPVRLSNLVLDPRTPASIGDLKAALDYADPPIPQILVFDKVMMTRRVEGGSHAVLLLKLDFDKEKLYVIDPTLRTRMEPDVYDFNNFNHGWEALSNLNIMVYPVGFKVVSSSGPTIMDFVRRVLP
jgi:hypothetical protein